MDEDAGGADLRQSLRLDDERVGLAGGARAVDQARLELALGGRDRLARLSQVGDVVERVVEPEDVDAALRRRGDEAPYEVGADRPRADEEPATKGERQRSLRAAADGADPLPRALDAALDREVEAAAAGDLQVGEA